MKDVVNCLREFDGLKEAEQSPYMLNHGDYLTTNAAAFTGIPADGTAVTAAGTLLGAKFAVRHKSEAAMKAYTDQLDICLPMMEANYDFVDYKAQGDGAIVALAGIKGTSQNTTKTAPPAKPQNARFEFTNNVGDMELIRDTDKLAYGSVTVSFTNADVAVSKSSDMQMKLVVPAATIIYIDLSTTLKTLIHNQTKGLELNAAIALFNPNGLSPLAFPEPVIVPR